MHSTGSFLIAFFPSSQSLLYLQHQTVTLIGSLISLSICNPHNLCQTWRLSRLKWWAATVWIKDTKGCLDGAATDLFSENEVARELCNTCLWLVSSSFSLWEALPRGVSGSWSWRCNSRVQNDSCGPAQWDTSQAFLTEVGSASIHGPGKSTCKV